MDASSELSGYNETPMQKMLSSMCSNFEARLYEVSCMRTLTILLLATAALQAQERVPVIVELFTSEGCSSCPPADRLLAELNKTQPIPNVDVIVLSEHVEYWDSLGWKDPFSAKVFTARQQSYAQWSESSDVYTPEAVIDGHFTTVGSNRQNVLKAVATSGENQKTPLQISAKRDGDSLLVEVPAISKGQVWIAITQGNVTSHVEHGENGGRTLQHVGVVRSLTKLSSPQARIAIDKVWGSDLKLVVFVQDMKSGRILQAAQQKI